MWSKRSYKCPTCRCAGLTISVANSRTNIPTRHIYRTCHIYTSIEKLYDEFQLQCRFTYKRLPIDLRGKRLIEEYNLVCNQMLDELGEDEIENAVNRLKDVIYAWIETGEKYD